MKLKLSQLHDFIKWAQEKNYGSKPVSKALKLYLKHQKKGARI